MKVITYKNKTEEEGAKNIQGRGIIAIVYPEYKTKPETETEEGWCHKIAADQGIATYTIIDSEKIPTDRRYRNAWSTEGIKIKVAMQEARAIYEATLRSKRNAALKDSDIEMTKALESLDAGTIKQIKERRTELRDLPGTLAAQIQSAKTTDELDAIEIPVKLPA